MPRFIARWALLGLSVFAYQSYASDHADPIFHGPPEESLAGLFVFPHKDRLIVILNIHPGLKSPPPIEHLNDYVYRVHFDLTTPVSFDDKPQKLRFGGTVNIPSAIHTDASLEYSLHTDTKLAHFSATGLTVNDADINVYTGIRDDPFIFPKFFGSNVISMVASIPLSAFPPKQTDFIVWGGTYKKGKKLDHVGRSNRTMQPRLDFLNPLEPREHVAAINKRHDDPNFIQKILMSKLAPLFAIRDYDKFPDVMIYSHRFAPKFPNGRQLSDDVAAITCQTGDCLLWELSFADTRSWDWPRKSKNDKAFLNAFPFIAEPW